MSRFRNSDYSIPGPLAVRHAAAATLPVHRHLDAYVALVDEGEYLIRALEGNLRVRVGDLIFHPWGDAHGNEFGSDDVRLTRLPVERGSGSTLRGVVAVRGLSPQLLAELGRVPRLRLDEVADVFRHGDPVVPTVPALIQEALEGGLASRCNDLTGSLGVSRERLRREFQAWYGASRRTYRSDLRRRSAAILALTTDWSLSRIAIETGYTDQQHFAHDWQRTFCRSAARVRSERS